ncbi:MAG: 5-(carboxyamino)imidazole ribonucleotide mutase [Proteobacteria bacterium]|nr:5-(carboxyamino)imidazole ribonucleotide mutase [Pseudomonadota bacterium]
MNTAILSKKTILVGVVMGSQSDWQILKYTAQTLETLKIAHEAEIVSAHRTPDKLFQYAEQAQSRGLEVIIAGAGGAAHLPGMLAAKTLLPILGVPVTTPLLNGLDSLLSIVQMPAGIPVGTLAIGKSGAINAALLAAAILANKYDFIQKTLQQYREQQTQKVLQCPQPIETGTEPCL